VLVFVHSRKDTYLTAKELSKKIDEFPKYEKLFISDNAKQMQNHVLRSKNEHLKEIYKYGMGMHHAGMLRTDRSLMENCFKKGCIKVLFCTSTLAWGVNLPAYAVIINGTEYYDPE